MLKCVCPKLVCVGVFARVSELVSERVNECRLKTTSTLEACCSLTNEAKYPSLGSF